MSINNVDNLCNLQTLYTWADEKQRDESREVRVGKRTCITYISTCICVHVYIYLNIYVYIG